MMKQSKKIRTFRSTQEPCRSSHSLIRTFRSTQEPCRSSHSLIRTFRSAPKPCLSRDARKIILVDANAVLHRAFHALPALTDSRGRLVNAVYGFFTILLKALKDLKGDFLAICFDSPGPTFRHREFKLYKAHRVEKPELYEQLPVLLEIFKEAKFPFFASEGYEAEDLIGTLAKQAKKEKLESLILTGDLDTLQLVGPKTKVYAMKRGVSDTVLYDQNAILKKYGLSSCQIIDFKALVGDPSDNIPGVPNIGPKTASLLLQKYKTLENIFQNLDKIPPKISQNLKTTKKQVFQAKRLVEITQDAPVKLDLKTTSLKNIDFQKVKAKFLKLGFKSLIARLPTTSNKTQMNLF